MRGSGGYLNDLRPVGVHVEDKKAGTTGREKRLELLQESEMHVSQQFVFLWLV